MNHKNKLSFFHSFKTCSSHYLTKVFIYIKKILECCLINVTQTHNERTQKKKSSLESEGSSSDEDEDNRDMEGKTYTASGSEVREIFACLLACYFRDYLHRVVM